MCSGGNFKKQKGTKSATSGNERPVPSSLTTRRRRRCEADGLHHAKHVCRGRHAVPLRLQRTQMQEQEPARRRRCETLQSLARTFAARAFSMSRFFSIGALLEMTIWNETSPFLTASFV